MALAAVLYFITARLSLALAIPPGYASAVWPPSGIALAAVLLAGPRIWPAIALGAAAANMMVEYSVASAVLIAAGNTAEALAAAALLRRHAGDPGRFARGEDVVKFVLLSFAAAAIAATVAAATLGLGGSIEPAQAWRVWWTWWQGDATGMIIVAPLVLSWSAAEGAPWPRQKKLEAGAFALLLAGTVAAIAGDGSAFAPFSLTFVALPFIIWAAFRFGQREVASAIAVVCAVAVWYVLERRELFAGVAMNELLLMLLTFISMVVTTGLVLVAVLGRYASQVVERPHHDPLTGLPNGTLFRRRLGELLAAADERRAAVAVALVDIDRFKTVNDALGREAGDALLKDVAQRLSADSERSLVARTDGVQFALAAPVDPVAGAAILANESLARLFDAPYRLGGDEFRLSGRIGLALFPEHGREADLLFTRAETALKKAKAGGEHHLVYAPTMTERVAEKLVLENKLRHALEREEFVLHYQPKIALDSREIVGVEALIRWRSPEIGLVPPMAFVPLLEETGLILEAGRWALRRALVDQQAWRAAGLRVPRVAVNVSSIQLRQRNFVEVVEAEVVEARLGPAEVPIDLEITESRIMDDIEANIGKLRRLRELGVGIAIDDFGTGYSSLAYLAKLPVQVLKIDRTFIIRMLEDEEAMALVQTILSLARALRLTVVAEGVETEEQADVLATLGCEQIQGYFISKPLPPEEIAALLYHGR